MNKTKKNAGLSFLYKTAIIIIVLIIASCDTGGPVITSQYTIEYGGVWYVDEYGNDSNNGLSAEKPLASVNKALNLVRAAYSGGKTWPGGEANPVPARIVISGTIATDNYEPNAYGMVYINNAAWDNYPPLVFEGNTARPGTLDAAGKDKRVFYIVSASVTISGLTIKNGKPVYYWNDEDDYDDGHGGGIYITGTGNLTMDKSIIAGNMANSGGGVYVNEGSTFIMQDTAIKDNSSENSGGGVFVTAYSRIIMNEGAIITGNTAFSENGGGVNIERYSRLNMGDGSSISGNTSCGSGGGISCSGTFTMNGGSIINNNALDSGGGITLFRYSIFTMNGAAIISGNTANTGGGVYASRSNFTMNSGSIINNTAIPIIGMEEWNKYPARGGGIYIGRGMFTMNGGTIAKNTAESNEEYPSQGGGVCGNGGQYGSTFNLNNGMISGNTADAGGGIYTGGNLNINGGSVTGNTACYNGGGVYIDYRSNRVRDFIKSGPSLIDSYMDGYSLEKNKVMDNEEKIQDGAGHAVYLEIWGNVEEEFVLINSALVEYSSLPGEILMAVADWDDNNDEYRYFLYGNWWH